MELPTEFVSLYKHWDLHATRKKGSVDLSAFEHPEIVTDMVTFAGMRTSIWEKKYKGAEPPYTDDPVLSRYRFCNMLRELDRQTIEYHRLLLPLRDDFPLWLMNMFYCRMVARPETVRNVGLLSFNAKENAALEKRLLASERPRYGTPYVFPVSVIMRTDTPTRETFLARYVPRVARAVAKEIDQLESASVIDGVGRAVRAFGFNLEFLWTEVLIDVAYQYPSKIDLFKPFPVGPGARPTFMRIDSKQEPALLAENLGQLHTPSGLTYKGAPIVFSAENWEGIGCEFRKYTNLSKGKGRKRIFRT